MGNWLGGLIQKEITVNDTVLDLGCGIMQATYPVTCKSILGVDIWQKYLDFMKDKIPTVKMDMSEIDRFMDNSYDVVLCLDVLEHLEYDLALQVLDDMKDICRKKVIIYTPRHFDKNEQNPEGAWGLGENKHQQHISLILKMDLLKRRYTVKNPMGDGLYGKYIKR